MLGGYLEQHENIYDTTYGLKYIYSGIRFIGSPVKRVSRFTWNGITSVRTCTKLHRLIGSNIRFIGPVNLEPRVDTSKMSKRTDLSLAEKIALLDNESQLSPIGPLSVQ